MASPSAFMTATADPAAPSDAPALPAGLPLGRRPGGEHGYSNRRLTIYGLSLTVIGIISVIIGTIASLLEAEKTYHIHNYVNTHWVTAVFLFTGISAYLRERFKLDFFLYLTICFALVSLPVGIGTMFADMTNLMILTGATWADKTSGAKRWHYLTSTQLTAMALYSAFDVVNSLAATILSVLLLREISKIAVRYYTFEAGFKSRILFVNGLCLAIVSLLRVVLWTVEMVWVRFMFLHYTVDEPVWLCVFCMAAVLNMFVARRGSRVVMTAAVGITAVCVYPAFLYLWLDYRWYSNVKMTELTVHMPKQGSVLLCNIWLGTLHLTLTIGAIMEQVRLLTHTYANPSAYGESNSGSGFFTARLQVDHQLRRAIGISGLLFTLAASAFLFSDIVNLLSQSFFRVFYPTEQKIPLQLYAVGALCFITLKERVAMCFLPITFVVVLAVMHTSVFHIASYLYLSYHTYFHTNLCELFYFGSAGCDKKLSTVGAVSHFFEASLAVCVAGLGMYVITVVARLLRLHSIRPGTLAFHELKRKQWCESMIALIGGGQLIGGVIVFTLSTNVSGIGGSITTHPLLIIHSIIYRTCLSLALIIYPAVQIAFARQLLFYPLRNLTLCTISLFRFVEIITQLDYRNIGQDAGAAWSMFSAVEVCSLGGYYATLCMCAVLLHIGLNRPQFDFVEIRERAGSDQDPVASQRYTDNSNGARPEDADVNGHVHLDANAAAFKPELNGKHTDPLPNYEDL